MFRLLIARIQARRGGLSDYFPSLFVIASLTKEGVAIQPAGLLRRGASRNDKRERWAGDWDWRRRESGISAPVPPLIAAVPNSTSRGQRCNTRRLLAHGVLLPT